MEDGVDDGAGCGFGQEGGYEAFGVGAGVGFAVSPEIVDKEPESGETDAGVGQLDDEGMGLGQGFLPVLGEGPLIAELGGVGAEANDGEREGVPALEGLDAVANLGEGHGVTSLYELGLI